MTDHSLCKNCGVAMDAERTGSKTGNKSGNNKLLGPLVLTALFLYMPAMLLPFMTIEINGIKNTTTIYQSVVSLSKQGSWFIAVVVLVASIIIPVGKLSILFFLEFTKEMKLQPGLRLKLLKFVEVIGKWSMLDVFLLALMVTVLKLKPWMNVTVEPGALFFALVVIFTMLASQNFEKNHHAYKL